MRLDGIDAVTIKVAALAAAATSGTAAMTADWAVNLLGVPVPVLLAGFAGAALALAMLPKMAPLRMAVAVALGTAIGVYGTQFLAFVNAWGETPPSLAFFLGLFGQAGVSLAFRDGRDLLTAWLRQKLGLPAKEGTQ